MKKSKHGAACWSISAVPILLLVIIAVACSGHTRTALPSSPTARTDGVPPAHNTPTMLPLGTPQVLKGTIRGSDPECQFTTEAGRWDGVCQQFELIFLTDGTLDAMLQDGPGSPVTVFLKTATGEQIDMACCGPPSRIRVPVKANMGYRLEVAYSGRPPGYPNMAPINFSVLVQLFDVGTQPRESLRVILYADATRTQRLATGHLEVVDGPVAGSEVRFNEQEGLYETELPPGFVHVRAGAPGFTAVVIEMAVGTSIAHQVVLARREPLVDATHQLIGGAYVYPSKPGDAAFSLYGRVKIEILDGPQAGLFTFTEDDWGFYEISGLVPGLVRVRASRTDLETELATVTVSGPFTKLDFVMKRQ